MFVKGDLTFYQLKGEYFGMYLWREVEGEGMQEASRDLSPAAEDAVERASVSSRVEIEVWGDAVCINGLDFSRGSQWILCEQANNSNNSND